VDVSRSSAQQLLYLQGERFLEERALFLENVRPGMRVVDIGANIGYFMLLLRSLVGSEGAVICVEPSPENLPELRRNIRINHFQNVQLHEVAVGAQAGTVGIRSGINGGVMSSPDAELSSPICRLDELVDQEVDFVKIDVDGYEGLVLEGCARLFDRCRPVVLLEVHPHLIGKLGFTTNDIYRLVSQYYQDISAYEMPRPESVSLAHKISARYLRRGDLSQVPDVPALVKQSDAGMHNWTFWLVCRPSERTPDRLPSAVNASGGV